MKKKFIIITFLVIIITISTIFIVKKTTSLEKETLNVETEPFKNILGLERISAQDEVIQVVKKYVDKIPNLKEYMKKNNTRVISVKQLKDNFNIDIQEFEKLKYQCNAKYTTIEYSENYDDYSVAITCSKLLIKSEN